MARTLVWPKVCSTWIMVWTTVWPTVCTTVWPIVWTTVWQRFFSFWPIFRRKSVQPGQWWSKSVWSGHGLESLFGLGKFCSCWPIPVFGYGRSGQCFICVWSVWPMPVLGRGRHPGYPLRGLHFYSRVPMVCINQFSLISQQICWFLSIYQIKNAE